MVGLPEDPLEEPEQWALKGGRRGAHEGVLLWDSDTMGPWRAVLPSLCTAVRSSGSDIAFCGPCVWDTPTPGRMEMRNGRGWGGRG